MTGQKKVIALRVVRNSEVNAEVLQKWQDVCDVVSISDASSACDFIRLNKDNIKLMVINTNIGNDDICRLIDYANEEKLLDYFPICVLSEDINVGLPKAEYESQVSCIIPVTTPVIDKEKFFYAHVNMYMYMSDVDAVVTNMKKLLEDDTKCFVEEHKDKINEPEVVKELLINWGGVLNEPEDHLIRIHEYCRVLGSYFADNYPQYGISRETIENIAVASRLHDIGKLVIPDEIFQGDIPMTCKLVMHMKEHTRLGAELLEPLHFIDKKLYDMCVNIAMYHHERYDGKGYPYGKSGSDIPFEAQLVGIVDLYDTLVYRNGTFGNDTHKMAVKAITQADYKTAYLPDLIDAFEEVEEEMKKIALSEN